MFLSWYLVKRGKPEALKRVVKSFLDLVTMSFKDWLIANMGVEAHSTPLFLMVPRAGLEPARWGTTEGF